MRCLLAILLTALVLAAPVGGDAADAEATSPAVSDANLLANERYWPYQVALLEGGSVGVLIRVEPGGLARIDFGRDGRREVPIAETDLVERANRIRLGELDKTHPNFVLAIGSRLVDSGAAALAPFPLDATSPYTGFLCVFADPSAGDFAEIAKLLVPFRERPNVLTILFPQSGLSDANLRVLLRALGWTVPFVYDHLSEAYTRTLLPANLGPPAVLLQTAEGRVLLEAPFGSDLAPALESALDANFGVPSPSLTISPQFPHPHAAGSAYVPTDPS
jgi:hypothetical protein